MAMDPCIIARVGTKMIETRTITGLLVKYHAINASGRMIRQNHHINKVQPSLDALPAVEVAGN